MTKSPSIPAGAYPLSDLLFSPRAAFIWNHTRQSVAWMNPAARAVFASRLEDFSAAIPASLARRFAQVAASGESGVVKVKIAGAPRLSCSVEILNLADGQDGVIVAELGEEEEARARALPSPAASPAKAPRKSVRKAPAKAKRQAALKQAPVLTAEEMRAFKAVGRKVLRLCSSDTRRAGEAAVAEPGVSAKSAVSPDRAQALTEIFAAFDLVLFLSEALDIVGLKGRPARLDWRKSNLSGKSVTDLLAPFERSILRRMLKKLDRRSALSAAGMLLVGGEGGEATPCRAILGRSPEAGAAFFLAFVSLEPPARLKRLQTASSATRLAA